MAPAAEGHDASRSPKGGDDGISGREAEIAALRAVAAAADDVVGKIDQVLFFSRPICCLRRFLSGCLRCHYSDLG